MRPVLTRNHTSELVGIALVVILGLSIVALVACQPAPVVGSSANIESLTRTISKVREKKSHVVLPEMEKTYADDFSSSSTVTVETILP